MKKKRGNCFVQSFACAAEGIWCAVRRERNMKIHITAALCAVGLGVWCGLTRGEWEAIIICIALVFALELVNTAIEAAVDLASPELHPLAKLAKDYAAGAVLVEAIATAVIGALVFLPKLISI